MAGAYNRAWGARTRFSDDPFVSKDALPHNRDDLKCAAIPFDGYVSLSGAFRSES